MTEIRVAPGGRFPLRFGIAMPTSGPFSAPETIFEFAEAAQNAGFDDVWVNDHLTFERDQRPTAPLGTIDAVGDEDPTFFESVTTAAALLGRLPRIGVGIGGLAIPLRDPRWLAKQVISLHELTGRRLTLGPALGMIPRSFEIMQIPFERRGRLFDEYIQAVIALRDEMPPVSFRGETIAFERANFFPRASELRLLIAGEGERVLGRAAKWGDGWLTSYPELTSYARKVRTFRDLAAANGRDPDLLDTAALAFISLASSYERAIEISGPSLAMRFESVEHAREVSIIGTASDAIERLTAMYRAGMRYVHLRPVTRDTVGWLKMVELIGRDVLPAAKAATESVHRPT
jgi:alkanesulfonate monooxygenase SsuD/methylene tetrahydromethanopterin reductase-like flavin-dependent oxidoreductase (luciferase family)